MLWLINGVLSSSRVKIYFWKNFFKLYIVGRLRYIPRTSLQFEKILMTNMMIALKKLSSINSLSKGKIFLDFWLILLYNTNMSTEITTRMSPEGLEIANSYLANGNVSSVCQDLDVPRDQVVAVLNKREIQKYIDTVYMDSGYRNRFKLAETLDKLIDQKLEEAEESEIYTNKDLADLLMMQHKIRMDEMKAQTESEKAKNGVIKTQNNLQINTDVPFGQGNYGTLMRKLLEAEKA